MLDFTARLPRVEVAAIVECHEPASVARLEEQHPTHVDLGAAAAQRAGLRPPDATVRLSGQLGRASDLALLIASAVDDDPRQTPRTDQFGRIEITDWRHNSS